MFNRGDIVKVISTYEHPVHKKHPCAQNVSICCPIISSVIPKDTILEILEAEQRYVTGWLPTMGVYIYGTYAKHFTKISR